MAEPIWIREKGTRCKHLEALRWTDWYHVEKVDAVCDRTFLARDVVRESDDKHCPPGTERCRQCVELQQRAEQQERQSDLLNQGELLEKEGVSAFFGTWPGDETEEELLDALKEIG